MLHPDRVTITLKGSGHDNTPPIEARWSPRNKRELARLDETGADARHRQPDPRLVQAVVRAHAWLKLLSDGTHHSVGSLAEAVGLHPKVIRKAIRLAFLAPNVTKAVLFGQQRAAMKLGNIRVHDCADARARKIKRFFKRNVNGRSTSH